jgi:Fe-Mn family superoxide dismutase
MQLQVRPLALDPAGLDGLSRRLITSHHENNYGGAVERLNAIRQQLATLDWTDTPVFTINGLKREELIAANSAWLHELYFDSLGGNGVVPAGGMSVALERDFGSVARWHDEFASLAKAMAGGSGWALLSWSAREARLVNHWAADHTHLLAGATAILALDMYEHAYHLDFGARASAYVDAFMKNIAWDGVFRRYSGAVQASSMPWAVRPEESLQYSQLVDVRRAQTYAEAPDRLPGAIWRDPTQLASWSRQLDRGNRVLVYCLHGLDIGRSSTLALRARGFDAYFIAGGIEGCREAGLPLSPKNDA